MCLHMFMAFEIDALSWEIPIDFLLEHSMPMNIRDQTFLSCFKANQYNLK